MGVAALVAAGRLAENVSLAPLTTYKVGGPTRFFFEAGSEDDLIELSAALREDAAGGRRVPALVLGRGSNVVVADSGFDGVVVKLGSAFAGVSVDQSGVVDAGGATSVPRLARAAVSEGRGGLEFFVGVPGSVGGAVRMNAGCHGSETVDWLIDTRVIDLEAGRVEVRPAASLGLSYRSSNLGPGDVVLGARFRTKPIAREDGEREMRRITAWRRENQPGGTFNAGSVFKNPNDDAAGRLIDSLGLKGFRIRSAAVSEKHANFFVADSGAPAQDVYELVHEVRRRVGEATGVWLEPEIRFVGEFEEP